MGCLVTSNEEAEVTDVNNDNKITNGELHNYVRSMLQDKQLGWVENKLLIYIGDENRC